ncbi:hypothetical protein SAMN04488116_1172 [Flagellimonas flava]|uniref:Uncharacterized protein n=1 Tax=Flagellimonas flava TaxID=570519 RepID=A0A1M5J7Y4_9FLAO|nr:hypothetical protein SAMN04488116_1172 [Allomuricauda flava]
MAIYFIDNSNRLYTDYLATPFGYIYFLECTWDFICLFEQYKQKSYRIIEF